MNASGLMTAKERALVQFNDICMFRINWLVGFSYWPPRFSVQCYVLLMFVIKNTTYDTFIGYFNRLAFPSSLSLFFPVSSILFSLSTHVGQCLMLDTTSICS
jgi:hypothetical protein